MRAQGQASFPSQPDHRMPEPPAHVVHALPVGAGRHLKGEVLQVLLNLRAEGGVAATGTNVSHSEQNTVAAVGTAANLAERQLFHGWQHSAAAAGPYMRVAELLAHQPLQLADRVAGVGGHAAHCSMGRCC